MQPIDRISPTFNNRLIIILKNLLNLLKLLLIFKRSAAQEPNLQRFQSELFFSYCIDTCGKIDLTAVNCFLLLKVKVVVVV